MRRALAVVVAGVVAGLSLVACGSDDDGTTSTGAPATAAPATDAVVATEPVTTQAAAATDPPATDAPPATEPVTTEPEPSGPSFAEVAGLATIELQPTEAGAQPLLAWTPVDGAAAYHLVALASDAKPYWGWTGEATEVRFGGAPDGGGQTAVVYEPLTWTVLAVDADALPLAVSERGQLTP